MNYLVTMCTN